LSELRRTHPDKRVWLCFQDEARFGLKPTYRRVWAPVGQRPIAASCARYEWCYVFASVHPESGTTHALILPVANTQAMQLYLADFAASLPVDVVALLVLDGASWHRSPKLTVPDNLRLVFLPPYTPELNPAEHLWSLLREVTANQAFADINALETRLAERCVWLTNHSDEIASSTSFHGYQISARA
jgi:hypothetical protein